MGRILRKIQKFYKFVRRGDLNEKKLTNISWKEVKTISKSQENVKENVCCESDNRIISIESQSSICDRIEDNYKDECLKSKTYKNDKASEIRKDNKISTNDSNQNSTSPSETSPYKPTAIVKPCTHNDSKIQINDEIDISCSKISEDVLKKENILSSESHEQNTIKSYTNDDIGKINNELQKSEREANILVNNISIVNENYNQMMEMVKEYEITVQKLVADKDKELVCKEIELERHSKLKEEIIQDHQNVERAFNDLSQKYERTRSVVVGLQEQEEDLKKKVEDLSQKQGTI